MELERFNQLIRWERHPPIVDIPAEGLPHDAREQVWVRCLERAIHWAPYCPTLHAPSTPSPTQSSRRSIAKGSIDCNTRILQRRQWFIEQSLLLVFFLNHDTLERRTYSTALQDIVDQYKLDAGLVHQPNALAVKGDFNEEDFYAKLVKRCQSAKVRINPVLQDRRRRALCSQRMSDIQTEMNALADERAECRSVLGDCARRLEQSNQRRRRSYRLSQREGRTTRATPRRMALPIAPTTPSNASTSIQSSPAFEPSSGSPIRSSSSYPARQV